MNKILRYLSIILTSIMLPSIVMAAPSAPSVKSMGSNESGDLYYASATANGSPITAFLAGSSTSNATSYPAANGASYISLPNGNYYVWAKDATGAISSGTPVNVAGSCSNISASNATGSGTVERCFIKSSSGSEKPTTSATLATCAGGYYFSMGPTSITYNDCGRKVFTGVGLSQRYCRKTYNYVCSKAATSYNSKLADLSISTGDLTPSFSADTATYSASTTESSVNISATLQNSNASFQDGFGPRTVSLKYGLNNVYVKTSTSNGGSSNYLIKITREDNSGSSNSRSTNNYLSSLSVDGVEISPSFSSDTVNYTATVDGNVGEVNVDAALQDNSASFVDGYGPRRVTLSDGNNRIYIKIKSESGKVRVYTIHITRGESASSVPTSDSKALLKSLDLSSGTIAFDANTFDYNATVDYDITNIIATAVPENDTDVVTVTGGDNLEVGSLNQIVVTVTSSDNSVSNTYTVYVNRKEENITISSNSLLQDLKIAGYKIKFDAKTTDYSITLKKDATELSITATPSDSKSSITIEGNENLKSGSEVKIRVTAEDGTYTDYYVNVNGVKKGGNVFLTIFVIILIILFLAYLVLRAMGYKIYFNVSAIKDYAKKIFQKR
jgi:hypothetical protein